VLLFIDFELLGHVVPEYGGGAFGLELDLVEPFELDLAENLGDLSIGLMLELLHGLAHHLPALLLDGVSRLLPLELGCGLLLSRVDLGLESPVSGAGKLIADAKVTGIDGRGVDLRIERLGLGFLGSLSFHHVVLLAELLEDDASTGVGFLGDLLDGRLLGLARQTLRDRLGRPGHPRAGRALLRLHQGRLEGAGPVRSGPRPPWPRPDPPSSL